eukprot:11084998-Lingulodinium_polyedra.AAC.1
MDVWNQAIHARTFEDTCCGFITRHGHSMHRNNITMGPMETLNHHNSSTLCPNKGHQTPDGASTVGSIAFVLLPQPRKTPQE